MDCINTTLESASTTTARYNRSREIILGLIAGHTKAYTAIYPTLQHVLDYVRSRNNTILVYEGITTPEALLSHLFVRGKFSPGNLTTDIVDIDKWVWTIATRELISLVRSKKKKSFVKSFQSYDEPVCADDPRTLLDKLGDRLEEEKKEKRPSNKKILCEVAKRMEELNVGRPYKSIFYGMVARQDKKTIMLDFKNAVICENGEGYVDDARYSANYDLIKNRGQKYLREHISYYELVSEMMANRDNKHHSITL